VQTQRQKKSIFKQYRIVPLVAVGVIVMVLLYGLSLLVWTMICYLGNIEPALNGVPAAIWLIVIFLSCGLMTLLIRGGTVFPSVVVSLAAAITACFLYPMEELLIGGILLKVFLTLITGVLGFTVVKLLIQLTNSRKKQKAVPSLQEPEQ